MQYLHGPFILWNIEYECAPSRVRHALWLILHEEFYMAIFMLLSYPYPSGLLQWFLWLPIAYFCPIVSEMMADMSWRTCAFVNSLWPSDAIWRQGSGSALAQVMACCLTAPSHYLNQCWLIISKVQWHSSEGSFTKDTSAIRIQD